LKLNYISVSIISTVKTPFLLPRKDRIITAVKVFFGYSSASGNFNSGALLRSFDHLADAYS